MKKLLYHWNALMSTFWFFPLLTIIGAIAMSVVLVYIDGILFERDSQFRAAYFITNPDSAKVILSVISGAMISVAGIVFSVTLVVLSLASSQFGSRLIANFMNDRMNQIVLGSYISVYLYCLIVLSVIRVEVDGSIFVPSVAIIGAILASLLNIVLLVFYIHNVAYSIQADSVISNIYNSILANAQTLYPEDVGEEVVRQAGTDEEAAKGHYAHKTAITNRANGYLQYIDAESLMQFLADNDAMLDLDIKIGDYLIEYTLVGYMYTNEKADESVLDFVTSQFIVGNTRTPTYDLEYSINQMVQVASKALSPGVNDPFTAISCIDNLSTTIAHLTHVKMPSRHRFDEAGNLRFIANVFSFEDLLNAAFNQIRQYSAGNVAVMIRLMDALAKLHGLASRGRHKKALERQANMVLRLAERTIEEKNDLADLKSISVKIFR